MMIQRLLLTLLAITALMVPANAQIKSGKAIQISISGVPHEEKISFPDRVIVQKDGMIDMPHIGKVKAAGLSAGSLSSLLQKKYIEAEIYTRPVFQVIVNDGSVEDQRLVVIGGFVRRPGPTPFFDNITLWQAIQAAGGPNEFGSMNRVELTRNGKVTQYDCTKAQFQQIRLLPGDGINVPQKKWHGLR